MSHHFGSLLSNHSGQAVVFDLPAQFDLCGELRSATSVCVASAFAKMSGWHYLREAIEESSAKVKLIAGTYFCQTEPALLRDWLALAGQRPNVSAFLVEDGRCFHSKIAMIHNQAKSFAIVGSGNLTEGGLITNFECSVYCEREEVINGLSAWIDELPLHPLSSDLIDHYEYRFNETQRVLSQSDVTKNLFAERPVSKKDAKVTFSDAISSIGLRDAARRYIASGEYSADLEKANSAIRAMRTFLNYPTLDFDEQGWMKFSSTPQFGWIDARHKKRIIPQLPILRSSLRNLMENTEDVLPQILDDGGSRRMTGVGLNTLSKFLIVHQPERWALINAPVRHALAQFGFEFPSRISAVRYLALSAELASFSRSVGFPHCAALDAFFAFGQRPEFRDFWSRAGSRF